MSDEIIRAITTDGAFRAVGVRLGTAAASVLDVQRPTAGQEVFAELLVAALLVRESMAPKYRVQVSLRSQGAMMLADTHPDGLVRGMVSGRGALAALGEDVQMHVARLMPEGRLQQGVVESDASGVSASLSRYMQQSEQVTSTIGIVAECSDDGLYFASGFLLQLLPDVEPRSLEAVTEALESLPEQWPRASAEEIVGYVLGEAGHSIVERREPFFGCMCSDDRVLGALATMGRDEIESVVEAEEEIDVECEYCGTEYHFVPAQIARLLEA